MLSLGVKPLLSGLFILDVSDVQCFSWPCFSCQFFIHTFFLGLLLLLSLSCHSFFFFFFSPWAARHFYFISGLMRRILVLIKTRSPLCFCWVSLWGSSAALRERHTRRRLGGNWDAAFTWNSGETLGAIIEHLPCLYHEIFRRHFTQ